MELSNAGARLLPIAVRVIDAAAELASESKAMQGRVSGTLRLGTIIDPESIRLGPLLGALLRFYPLIDVRLQHGISGSVLGSLRARELDACFFVGSVTDPAIAVMPLDLETCVVIGPRAWQAQLAGAGWAEIAEMPWVGAPARKLGGMH